MNYLGNGDFKTILDSKPYHIPINILPCVGHVKRRMGSRLRKLKSNLGNRLVCDRKTLKNAGRRTDQLQDFYGKAV